MDPHRLAEERSVAYHRVIAERLQRQPEILAGDISSIVSFLTERSELADELRQSSPFAGALEPRERWKIWRETRDHFSQQP
jgi:hypothetical protein